MEEWGPWIEHDGSGCPCVGRYAHMVLGIAANGRDPIYDSGPFHWPGTTVNNAEWMGVIPAHSDYGSWDWHEDYYPVVRYRIRKPRAIQQLREMIADVLIKVRTDA